MIAQAADPEMPRASFFGRVGPMELVIFAVLGFVALALVVRILRWMFRAIAGSDRKPPPREAAAQPEPVRQVERERVVERQILVVRCRFCQKLTAADLSACSECGAKQ